MIVASLLSEELAILLDDVFPDHRLKTTPGRTWLVDG